MVSFNILYEASSLNLSEMPKQVRHDMNESYNSHSELVSESGYLNCKEPDPHTSETALRFFLSHRDGISLFHLVKDPFS